MKQVNVPLILSFSCTQIKDFKVYTGSSKGAVKYQAMDIVPSDIWGDEIGEKEEIYKKLSLAFIDHTKLCVFPCQYSYKYKLENGVYKIYSNRQERWLPFAHKKGNSLIIKLGLTSAGSFQRPQQLRTESCDQTRRGAFRSARCTTPTSFRGNNEMIAWCNVHYVFQ